MLEILIKTERLIIKNLTVDELSSDYLSWLTKKSNLRYIVSAKQTKSLEDLKNYLKTQNDKKDVIFLGLFDRYTSLHIGNIKFEQVNLVKKYAVVGILIGNDNYKGIGIVGEVFANTFQFLNQKLDITKFLLGVNTNNIPAIKAYNRIGFRESNSNILESKSNDAIIMEFNFQNKY